MSRVPALLALVAALALPACDDDPVVNAPSRLMTVELHEESRQSLMRAQPAGVHSWSGRENDTVAVQMTAPVEARASVTAVETIDGDSPDEIAIFLDGAGQLGDFGTTVNSLSLFDEPVLPSTYDVLIAPDALLGKHAARLITPVTLSDDVPPDDRLLWDLQPVEEVLGKVATYATNQPVAGAVVTFYRASEPRLPVGVTTVTDADGEFFAELPEGRYDIVLAGPGDGSVPIPPVRLLDQQLPLFQGAALRLEVPVVPTRPVRGSLVRAGSETPVAGRVRIEGQLTDLLPGGTGIAMGRYRAEFETEADGSWEAELPLGAFTATGIPRYAASTQTLGIGTLDFEVPFGVPSVEGLDVTMPPTVSARIEAYNPGGSPMVGATLVLRMKSAPRYSWRRVTGASGEVTGAFVGLVIEDEYDIELIPPPDEDGQTRIARVQTEATFAGPGTVLRIEARRSDRFQGVVFTEGQQEVGDVHVLLRDPETGELWDTAVSRDSDTFTGVFEAVVPR